MKNIQEYKHKKVFIKVNNEEEYDALVPLLNTIFTGWMTGKYHDYKDRGTVFYIGLNDDFVTRHPEDYHPEEIIEAQEFLTGEPEVINNYQIY